MVADIRKPHQYKHHLISGTRATSLPTQLRCLPRPRCHLQLHTRATIDQPPSPRDPPLPPHLVSRRTALVESELDGCCATTWEGGLPQPLQAPPRSTRHTASAPPRPQPTMVLSFPTPFPTSGPPPCQLPSSTVPPDPQRLRGVSSNSSSSSRVSRNHLPCSLPLVPPSILLI